jgi:glycosyltransferase involved in cell wall biosynthesis
MKQFPYWHAIQLSRVAILGIYPPPYGGVSVHIQRVMDCFSMQNNALLFWPTEQRRTLFPVYLVRLWWRLVIFRPKYLYYHSTYLASSPLELLALIIFRWFLQYQIFIVDHDCRHLHKRRNLTRKLYRWIIERVHAVICIGELTKQSYVTYAMDVAHMVVEDAFIVPIKRNAHLIRQTYPSSLAIFMKEHTPLLLVSAAHLMCIDGKDMYGIDTTLWLLAGITHEYPDVGLIIGLPRIGDEKYFALLQHQMKRLQVIEHIYIMHGNKELWPLFEQVDLFLRPTRTDGDSISVREALYFKVPVVASNVCARPSGVYCFNLHDNEHAISVTKKVLRECVYGSYRERDYLYP